MGSVLLLPICVLLCRLPLPPCIMPVSMKPSARYVTQERIWDVQIGKQLTDRRIAQLAREGRYGPDRKLAQLRYDNQKKQKAKRLKAADLLYEYF